MILHRSALALSLAAVALVAQAEDAYNNAPDGTYRTSNWMVATTSTVGFQFTSALSGEVTGVQAALNRTSTAFKLSLYADDGDKLGTLLGTFDGQGSGITATSGLVSAKPTSTSLASVTKGSKYWLVGSTDGSRSLARLELGDLRLGDSVHQRELHPEIVAKRVFRPGQPRP